MATAITRKTIREGAALDLGLLTLVVVDTIDATSHLVKISDIRERKGDPFTLKDAYISPRMAADTGNDWNRILRYVDPETPDTLELAGGPDGMTNGDDAGIYELLSPTEWNMCVNEALGDMWKKTRVAFNFVDSDNEYPTDLMTDTDLDLATWITTRGQIEGISLKDTSGNIVSLEGWSGAQFIEGDNSVVVNFGYLPAYRSNLTGVLIANKPYSYPGRQLTTDVIPTPPATTPIATTTCPYKLAMVGTQVKALKLLFSKLGSEAMRSRFGAALSLREGIWATEKNKWMPPFKAYDLQIGDVYSPDIPNILLNPSW